MDEKKDNPLDAILPGPFLPELVRNFPDALSITDLEGRILELSPMAAEIHGFDTVDEFRGQSSFDFVAPEDRPLAVENAEKVLRGEPGTFEYTLLRKDGSRFPAELSVALLRDTEGRPVGLIGSTRDITERMEAAEARRASEEKYRTLAEQSLQGIGIARGLPPRLVFANRAFGEILGYTVLELVSLSGAELGKMIRPDDRERFLEVYRDLMEGRRRPPRYEFSIVRRDGEERWLEVYAKRIVYLDEPAVQATLVDITKRKRAENALRESEENYRRLVEQSLQGIVIATGMPPRIRFANTAFAGLVGYSVEELLALSPEEVGALMHPEDRDVFIARYQDRMAGKISPGPVEMRVMHKDGTTRYLEVLSTQIQFRGNPAAQAVFVDVDKRKRAEEQIRASEERYRLLLELNPAGIVIHGEGKILYANRMAQTLFSAKEADILGKPVLEFVHPDYRDIARQRIRRLGESGGVAEPIEEKFLALDGRVMEVVVSGIPIESFEGKPATMIVFQDITEKRRIEEALKGTEGRFRAILESTSDWVWEVNTENVYTYASPRVKDLLGYEPEEVLGRHYLEFKDAEEAERIRKRFEKTAGEARPFMGIETKNLRKDGTPVVLETSGVPFFDAKGRLAGYRGIDRDITARKKITDALGRSEERYRTTIDSMQDGIHVVDTDLRILLVNKRIQDWVKELGLDGNFIGRNVMDAFPFLSERIRGEYRKVFEEGESLVTEEENEIAGRTLHTLTMKIPIREAGGVTRVVTILRDITESKVAEKALKESEGRYRLLFENSPIGISVVDLETRTALYVNPAFCTMLGYTESEFKSKSFHTLTREDAQGGMIERFERLVAGASTFATATPFLKKDGAVIYLNCNAGPARVDGRPCSIGFHVDVTEVMKAMEERRRFHLQMQQTQKLESLGVLAGGIAHDFNNLLTGVLGNADLARMELDSDHPARPFVLHIETATRRLADLTNQMLAYSGKGQFVVEPLHLSKLVEEMGRLLEISISKDVDLVYEVKADLPLIKADPTQIRQVVMNLITNSSEALEDRPGRIVARTGVVEADRKLLGETVLGEELPEGTYVLLEVADTGCGMDPETRAKIFDPFFTTKFTGRGLGLAAVLGIVRSHGGAIRLESEPGRGTTFRILLPVAAETRDRTRKRVRTGEWRGEGTILVIDDEKAVRLVAQDMLEKTGFTVVTAASGKEGLERFREHREAIRAVLLDLTMPKMGGKETFTALRRLRPGIPVILFSGYTERDATRQFAGKGLSGFVQKPFDSGRLLQPLRAALEEEVE